MKKLVSIGKVLSVGVLGAGIAGVTGLQAWAQTEALPPDKGAEIQQLRELVLKLQSRVEQLEAQQQRNIPSPPSGPESPTPPASRNAAAADPPSSLAQLATEDRLASFFKATTIGVGVDVYYGYNFNNPIGRVNRLRAYDVSSNAFS